LSDVPLAASLAALRREEAACQRCSLYQHATQVVPGEGPLRARLMLIGEQPGDREDLAGKPFVGPVGRVLSRAMQEAAVPRHEVFVTNAVKHFRFEQGGKRRIHQRPAVSEIEACRWWLDRELALIKPAVILALGTTAARAVLGRTIAIHQARDRTEMLADGTLVRVTIRPSALLRRQTEAEIDAEYQRFVGDLRMAGALVGYGATAKVSALSGMRAGTIGGGPDFIARRARIPARGNAAAPDPAWQWRATRLVPRRDRNGFWLEAIIPDDPRHAIGTDTRPAPRTPRERPHDFLMLADDDDDRGQRERDAGSRPDPDAKRRTTRRLIGFAILGALLLVAGIGFGIYWWTVLRFYASTDDAYTQADAVIIAPQVSGYVTGLLVTDNQRVHAGETLLQIDPRPYQATLDQSIANQEKDQANLANAQTNFSRDAAVIKDNLAISRQQYDTDNATVAADKALVDGDKAQVETARLNLGYATIVSPVDGAVGDRSVQFGGFVQPGEGLMTIVPMGRAIYVVANFKETQIEQMFRGEQADLSIDSFPGVHFTGTVASLAPGSGAEFALLPPENATGNFTKIVQRVPVKILIDNPPPDRLDQLRPGLSVEVSVDSRTAPPKDQRQTLVPLAVAKTPPPP